MAIFRATVRFLGAVVATSGVLLIADAALTVAWQEPVSAFVGSRSQARLERELEQASVAAAADLRELGGGGDPAFRARELAGRLDRRLGVGDVVGRLELPSLDRSYAMVEGTDTATLRKGPAHYPDTPLPGQGGTVAVAGHRTTFLAPFRTIDRLGPGDEIVAEMPYGRFTYRVEGTKIVRPDAVWVKRKVRYERLILTACHPVYSAAQRIVVFAKLKGRRLAPQPPRTVAGDQR